MIRIDLDRRPHSFEGLARLSCTCGEHALTWLAAYDHETVEVERNLDGRGPLSGLAYAFLDVGYREDKCDICRGELSRFTRRRIIEREGALLERLGDVAFEFIAEHEAKLAKSRTWSARTRKRMRELLVDARGGLFPQGPNEGGGYAGLTPQSATFLSPQNIGLGSTTPDTFAFPATWAAAGTGSLVSPIDGGVVSVLDPLQKLTAANTATLSDQAANKIDNAANLVLNAAGAGTRLQFIAAGVTQWAHMTAP